ncbi:hypothetical protein PybrP1_011995 [[Pythium] brassicae (nom. inval.)]|nr:hypothetical protein PybrP1_011995 [[Pythium] brassicae (nom. inval.)]
MSRLVVSIGRVEFTIAAQTLYVVKVQQDADEWEVKRTYSDFRKLRDDVARVMKSNAHADASSDEFAAAAHELPFPAKRLFGSRSERVVRERAVELHHFLIRLLLLTHTYRKAQKQQLDDDPHAQQTPQASATVFFLLRDFLKPDGAPLGSAAGAAGAAGVGGGAAGGAAHSGAADNDDDVITRRMIRESKMLAMRSSGAHPPKTKSAPDVLAYGDESDEQHDDGGFASKSTADLLRQHSEIPILEEVPMGHSSGSASKKMLQIASLRSRSQRTDSNSSSAAVDDRPRNESTASATERQRNASTASNASTTSSSHYALDSTRQPHHIPHPYSNHRQKHHHSQSHHHPQHAVLASVQQNRGASSASSTPLAIPSAPSASTSSSSMYIHGSAPSSTSSSSAAAAAAASTRSSSQKKAAARSKPRSASAREARDSARKSRLSPQLAAQSVTLGAQKELEQFLSEYSAIMILRYVDRFVNKAVTKAPGCYTVSADLRLVIDSERFFEELEETFKDLPADFAHNFRHPLAGGDWLFPPALDAYVQMKWQSFRSHGAAGGGGAAKSTAGSCSSRSSAYAKSRSQSHHRRQDSDSSDSDDDDDDSEYEYEEATVLGGGYMKPKKDFTAEEADVLDKMIANGTAGRDQMLRLRRQVNEMGWNRRANPGDERASSTARAKKQSAGQLEFWTDTDDDEHRQTGSSGGEELAPSAAADTYQRKHNVVRKERPSRREGGLV